MIGNEEGAKGGAFATDPSIVSAVNFLADDGEVRRRCFDGIGFPEESDGRHVDRGLKPAHGAIPCEPELLGRILVMHGFVCGLPDQFERHPGGRGDRIQCRPTRLIDDGNISHFQRDRLSIGADCQARARNRSYPIEPGRRDGRMEIVNLIGGDRRSPKQSQSYMCECTMLRGACSPVFTLHQPIVGGGAAERDPIPLVVRAHARERATACDQSLEMVDVGRLQVRSGRLIMAAILVEPGNGVRLGAPIRRL